MTVKPDYVSLNRKENFTIILPKLRDAVESNVKALLHAHRDELRNLGKNTDEIAIDCRSGYVGEAFGIMRALEIQGFGYFGPTNIDGEQDKRLQPEQNLKWWFSELEQQVLEEENFRRSGQCAYCFDKYGKDTYSMRFTGI